MVYPFIKVFLGYFWCITKTKTIFLQRCVILYDYRRKIQCPLGGLFAFEHRHNVFTDKHQFHGQQLGDPPQ
jgi:hypothetical protein